MRVVTAVLLLFGCEGANDYSDTPDLASIRRAFLCGSAVGSARDACDTVDAFERASAVRFPATRTVYVGQPICSTGLNPGAFKRYALEAGTPTASRRVDVAHLPAGFLYERIISYNDQLPGLIPAAEQTLRALANEEPTPGVAASATEAMPRRWEEWRGRRSTSPVSDLAQSDGRSLLIAPGRTPAAWDDAQPRASFTYIRQEGRELYAIRPPTGSGPLGHEACVVRAFSLPEGE
ncbi:MAG: hypothetical protein AAGE52_00855 [Myxococcota bacterium]